MPSLKNQTKIDEDITKQQLRERLKSLRTGKTDDEPDEKLELKPEIPPNTEKERDMELEKLRRTLQVSNIQGYNAIPTAVVDSGETEFDQENLIAISRANFRKSINRLDIISVNGKIKSR